MEQAGDKSPAEPLEIVDETSSERRGMVPTMTVAVQPVLAPSRALSVAPLSGAAFFWWLLTEDVFAMTWCPPCGVRYFAVPRCVWCGAACMLVGDLAARRITRACRRDRTLVRRVKAEWIDHVRGIPPKPDRAAAWRDEAVTPLKGLPWRDEVVRRLPWLDQAWRAAPPPRGRPVDFLRRHTGTGLRRTPRDAGGRGTGDVREARRRAAWGRERQTSPRARLRDAPRRSRSRCRVCQATVGKTTRMCRDCDRQLTAAVKSGQLPRQTVDGQLLAGRGDILRLILRTLADRRVR